MAKPGLYEPYRQLHDFTDRQSRSSLLRGFVWVISQLDWVPHGFSRMVLTYQVWFLDVLAVLAALFCLVNCRLLVTASRLLASHREQLLPVGQKCLVEQPDYPRRSSSEAASVCLTVRVHRTHGLGSDLGSRASSLMRFADRAVFDHPLSHSKNEFLSTITIRSRLAPRLQKPWRRPWGPLLFPSFLRGREENRPSYSLAEDHLLLHRLR